ncbi:unnamed protein product [Lactuca saligna]|uniref:Uncharacterized protein n=1 Tax=Lactuca saligna TaxID=75948 RepID=A0AA35YX39_LACSI|nr:unnamed protein product [Lactuca saligna]
MVSKDNCNFSKWIDPPLTKHYKDTMWNTKLRVDDLLTRNAQVTVLQKKVEKHKYLRIAKRESIDARIPELFIEIETLKKMVKKILLIGLVFLLVMVLYFKLF